MFRRRSSKIQAGTSACFVEDVDKLADGDEATFHRLYRAYSGSMLALAVTFLRDRQIAEEVVQDTWIAVLTGIGSFDRRSSLKSWIFAILANKARSRAKRERRVVSFSAFAMEDGDGGGLDPARFDRFGNWAIPPHTVDLHDPERLLDGRQMVRHLATAIENLPPAQKAVVVLRDIEGHDAGETCQILEISEANQRVLLHRARTRLRARLEELSTDHSYKTSGRRDSS